jgi:hypothetical protein
MRVEPLIPFTRPDGTPDCVEGFILIRSDRCLYNPHRLSSTSNPSIHSSNIFQISSSSRPTMSRDHGSSRDGSHSSRTQDEHPGDLVEQAKSIVTLLYEVVSSRPHEWKRYVASARSAMAALDNLCFYRDPARLTEQVWIIHGLPKFAYHDADSECIWDIAEY